MKFFLKQSSWQCTIHRSLKGSINKSRCLTNRRRDNTHKTFHILKMKAHLEKEPYFENESSFGNPFWKWKHSFGKVKINYLWIGIHCKYRSMLWPLEWSELYDDKTLKVSILRWKQVFYQFEILHKNGLHTNLCTR